VSRCKCYLILNGHGYQPCRKNVFLILALAAEALVEVSQRVPPRRGSSFHVEHGMARLTAVLLQNLSFGLGHLILHSSE